MNIVVIYAPTNAAEEKDKLDFYNELQVVLESAWKRCEYCNANAQVEGCNVGYEDLMGCFADGTMPR